MSWQEPISEIQNAMWMMGGVIIIGVLIIILLWSPHKVGKSNHYFSRWF